MIFIDFHAFWAWIFAAGMVQPAAPIETFARFQLPAIIDSLMLAAGRLVGWLAGWLVDWLAGWLAG